MLSGSKMAFPSTSVFFSPSSASASGLAAGLASFSSFLGGSELEFTPVGTGFAGAGVKVGLSVAAAPFYAAPVGAGVF